MIRVASVPATHVYVRRLSHPAVQRIADPSGDDLRTPSFLDPSWWVEHGSDIDLAHIHFGFEFYGAQQLEAVCDELDRQAVPLVYTCHDLRNPNHETSEVQDAALDVWMRRAAQIITLTDWAAEGVREAFGRRSTVLPHPHIVPVEELRRRSTASVPEHPDRFRVGIHFKSLRPNVIGAPLLVAALAAVVPHEGVRLRVDFHCDVLDPFRDVHDPALVDLAWRTVSDAASPIDLHVHHYLSDNELWQLIASVDAFLLPYRFGTHSGLLEACRDLGTAVIAPRVGGYADQGAQHLFDLAPNASVDATSLADAVSAAVAAGRPAPLPVAYRERQRAEVADAHVALYRQVLAQVGTTKMVRRR